MKDHYHCDVNYVTGAVTPTLGTDRAPEAFLAIGDEALRLRNHPDYPYRLDLADAWVEWTGLPFIFGASASIRDLDPDANDEKRLLRGTIVAAVNKMYLDCCFVAMRQEQALWPGILGDLE